MPGDVTYLHPVEDAPKTKPKKRGKTNAELAAALTEKNAEIRRLKQVVAARDKRSKKGQTADAPTTETPDVADTSPTETASTAGAVADIVPTETPEKAVNTAVSVESSARPSAAELEDEDHPLLHRLFMAVCLLGAGACNFALQVQTLGLMFPGFGPAAAGGLVLAEMGVGHGRTIAKTRSDKVMFTVGMLLFAALEAALPLIRETDIHAQAQANAVTASVPVESCPDKDMPGYLVGHPQSIKQWKAQERQDKADCAARQQKERKTGQADLVSAASEHSVVETPARMLFGAGISYAIGLMASVVLGRGKRRKVKP